MTTKKRTKRELSLQDFCSNEIYLSVSTCNALDIFCHDPTHNDYSSVRLSWEDAATLKRWLGRRLKERG